MPRRSLEKVSQMIYTFITDEMKRKAKDYAIQKEPTSYRRFGETKEEVIKMLYAGKIGEQIGQEALKKVGIPHQCLGMFEVIKRVDAHDKADAILHPGTDREKTVDFKTAWQYNHIRILIPITQGLKHDLYIGVKINLENNMAMVYGYQTREYIRTKHEIEHFGKGLAYWVLLEELRPLKELKHHLG